jgi:NADH-quinone oxidoreductase subunit N
MSWFIRIKYDRIINNSLIFIIAALACYTEDESIKSSLLANEGSISLLKSLLLFSGFIISHSMKEEDSPKQILVTASILGSMMMISAKDFLTLFFAIELAMIPVHLLVRRKNFSSEMRSYFFFNMASTVFFALAMGLIYCSMESISFDDVRYITSFSSDMDRVNGLSLLLVVASFHIRLGAFLCHFWISNLIRKKIFLAELICCTAQIAIAFVFYRLITSIFYYLNARNVILIIGLASMILISFSLIFQNNIKKIIAHIVAYHASAIFICSSFPSYNGMRGMVFSTISEMISLLGIFILLLKIKRAKSQEIENINDLNSLSCKHPILVLSISILFLSLMGFPPFLGFWGRFYICSSLIGENFSTAIYMISFVLNLIFVAKIFDVLWLHKGNESFTLDGASIKMIYLTSFLTIAAVPFAQKILELVEIEMYFAQ